MAPKAISSLKEALKSHSNTQERAIRPNRAVKLNAYRKPGFCNTCWKAQARQSRIGTRIRIADAAVKDGLCLTIHADHIKSVLIVDGWGWYRNSRENQRIQTICPEGFTIDTAEFRPVDFLRGAIAIRQPARHNDLECSPDIRIGDLTVDICQRNILPTILG